MSVCLWLSLAADEREVGRCLEVCLEGRGGEGRGEVYVSPRTTPPVHVRHGRLARERKAPVDPS